MGALVKRMRNTEMKTMRDIQQLSEEILITVDDIRKALQEEPVELRSPAPRRANEKSDIAKFYGVA